MTSTALAPCSSKRMPGIPDHVHSSRITACICMAHAVHMHRTCRAHAVHMYMHMHAPCMHHACTMHAPCIAACARADVRRSSAVSGWVRSEHVGKQRLAGRRHAKSPDGSSLCSGGAPSSRSSRQHATKSSITALPSNASSSTASSGTPVAAPTLRAAPPPEAGPSGRTRHVPATPPASCARPPRRRKTSPRPWTGHGPDPSSRRRTCGCRIA